MRKHKKKVPDYLRSLDTYLEKLTIEELYEFYLKQGYSDDDAMALSGMVESEEITDSE